MKNLFFLLLITSLLCWSSGNPIHTEVSVTEPNENEQVQSFNEELNSPVPEVINQQSSTTNEEEEKHHSTLSDLTTATTSEVSEHTQQTIEEEEEAKKESTLSDLTTATPLEVNEYTQQSIETTEEPSSVQEASNANVPEDPNSPTLGGEETKEAKEEEDSTHQELATATPPKVNEYPPQHIEVTEVSSDVQEASDANLSEDSNSSTLGGEETKEAKEEEDSTHQELASATPPEVNEYPPQHIEHDAISKVQLTDDDDKALMNDATVPPHQKMSSQNHDEPNYLPVINDAEETDYVTLGDMVLTLEDKLKLKIPSVKTYSSMNAILGADGSIYIPGSYSRTVKEHVANLMGLAYLVMMNNGDFSGQMSRGIPRNVFYNVEYLQHIYDLGEGTYIPELIGRYKDPYIFKLNPSSIGQYDKVLSRGDWTQEEENDMFQFAYLCYGVRFDETQYYKNAHPGFWKQAVTFCPVIKSILQLSVNETEQKFHPERLRSLYASSRQKYPSLTEILTLIPGHGIFEYRTHPEFSAPQFTTHVPPSIHVDTQTVSQNMLNSLEDSSQIKTEETSLSSDSSVTQSTDINEESVVQRAELTDSDYSHSSTEPEGKDMSKTDEFSDETSISIQEDHSPSVKNEAAEFAADIVESPAMHAEETTFGTSSANEEVGDAENTVEVKGYEAASEPEDNERTTSQHYSAE
ncbi:unnamed protein product [Trichobilharzia szidati]|nr:unnamed protein product [Trichobilharzia szidati]